MGLDARSTSGVRVFNRFQAIALLRRRGALSRADLGEALGLSRSTVADVVAELQRAGLIVETTDRSASEGTVRGRPPTLLALAPPAGVVVGVDLGHRHVRVALADRSGAILAEVAEAAKVDAFPAATLDRCAALVQQVLAVGGAQPGDVLSVVMGIPSPVNRRTGEIALGKIMHRWVGVSPEQELTDRIGMPVEIENDANLGALGEATYGAGKGHEDLIYLKVASGLGAGLILSGRIYRGATGIAGEIGHVQVDEEGPLCECGSRGCLGTRTAGKSLIDLLQPHHKGKLEVSDIVDLVAANDSGAIRVVGDAGRAIGRAVGDLANNLNPAMIVVGGELSLCGDSLVGPMRSTFERRVQQATRTAAELRLGELALRAEVLGAVAVGLERATAAAVAAGDAFSE